MLEGINDPRDLGAISQRTSSKSWKNAPPCELFSLSRAASAQASCARLKSSSARWRNITQPVYVRHEIVHNKHVVDDLKAKVPTSSRSCPKSPTAPSQFSARMACPEGGARGVGAAAHRPQRHVPPGRQGSYPSQALRDAGTDPYPHWSCRPCRSRGNVGGGFPPVDLVQTESDVANLTILPIRRSVM